MKVIKKAHRKSRWTSTYVVSVKNAYAAIRSRGWDSSLTSLHGFMHLYSTSWSWRTEDCCSERIWWKFFKDIHSMTRVGQPYRFRWQGTLGDNKCLFPIIVTGGKVSGVGTPWVDWCHWLCAVENTKIGTQIMKMIPWAWPRSLSKDEPMHNPFSECFSEENYNGVWTFALFSRITYNSYGAWLFDYSMCSKRQENW